MVDVLHGLLRYTEEALGPGIHAPMDLPAQLYRPLLAIVFCTQNTCFYRSLIASNISGVDQVFLQLSNSKNHPLCV